MGIKQEVDLDGLAPIPESARPMSSASYMLVMWSSAIIVQVMAIGTFLFKEGLSLYQTILVGLISAFLVALFCAINGFAGIKYGIPFSMQLRSSFGYRGAKLAYIIRIIPALSWYGIGTWIGAQSINAIMTILFNAPDLSFLYFFLLTAFQIYLSYNGITSIKWFDATVAIVIFLMLGYFLFTILTQGNLNFQQYAETGASPSWGLLFWGGVSAATANWATVMLNNSDLMRHVKPATARANFFGNFAGIIPPWMTMVFFGLLIFIGTGNDDPVSGLVSLAPNLFFGIILLIFIIFAQVSSNLTTSILPAALVFQDLFNFKWSTGVIISGVLSCLTAPWLLFTSDWFFWFQNLYSTLLGPILGVMLADYWVLRKGELNIPALYDNKSKVYWFFNGFSPAACAAIFIAGAISYWWLHIAWLVGLPSGFVLYLALKSMGFERKFEIEEKAFNKTNSPV